MRRRSNLALPLLFAALAPTACEDDQFTTIAVDLQVSPEEVDFGTAELGQDVFRTVELRSFSTAEVDIVDVQVEAACEDCFLAVAFPDLVAGNSFGELELRYRATQIGTVTGTVTVISNDDDSPAQTVFVRGRGVDTRKPGIEVRPTAVDFGFSPAGGVAVSSFVVRSVGTNDLRIDRIRVEPSSAPFRVTTSTPSPARPGVLPPGEQASVGLRVELSEGATGMVSAEVIIESNVIEELNVPGEPGWVSVPLSTVSNLPPVAVAGEDQTVEPFSRVSLDGSASFDQDDPPDEPLTYRWSLITRPDGSTAVMELEREPTGSFFADLTGTYEAQLVVTDALGLESEPETVIIEALPTNAVRIELTWDHPDADLDLHLTRPGGSFCDCATDVHYRDCGREPDWFPQTPGANPRLDVDDESGFGPENINIDGHGSSRFIPDGAYQISVHYYATNEQTSSWPTTETEATVRVFVFGLLAGELTQTLTNSGDLWKAGTLRWPDRTIEAGGEILQDRVCGLL